MADEVRALAHRTQQSTQEIEQMIGDVHQGTDKAVHAMQLSNERARTTLDLARAAGKRSMASPVRSARSASATR